MEENRGGKDWEGIKEDREEGKEIDWKGEEGKKRREEEKEGKEEEESICIIYNI